MTRQLAAPAITEPGRICMNSTLEWPSVVARAYLHPALWEADAVLNRDAATAPDEQHTLLQCWFSVPFLWSFIQRAFASPTNPASLTLFPGKLPKHRTTPGICQAGPRFQSEILPVVIFLDPSPAGGGGRQVRKAARTVRCRLRSSRGRSVRNMPTGNRRGGSLPTRRRESRRRP